MKATNVYNIVFLVKVNSAQIFSSIGIFLCIEMANGDKTRHSRSIKTKLRKLSFKTAKYSEISSATTRRITKNSSVCQNPILPKHFEEKKKPKVPTNVRQNGISRPFAMAVGPPKFTPSPGPDKGYPPARRARDRPTAWPGPPWASASPRCRNRTRWRRGADCPPCPS